MTCLQAGTTLTGVGRTIRIIAGDVAAGAAVTVGGRVAGNSRMFTKVRAGPKVRLERGAR